MEVLVIHFLVGFIVALFVIIDTWDMTSDSFDAIPIATIVFSIIRTIFITIFGWFSLAAYVINWICEKISDAIMDDEEQQILYSDYDWTKRDQTL